MSRKKQRSLQPLAEAVEQAVLLVSNTASVVGNREEPLYMFVKTSRLHEMDDDDDALSESDSESKNNNNNSSDSESDSVSDDDDFDDLEDDDDEDESEDSILVDSDDEDDERQNVKSKVSAVVVEEEEETTSSDDDESDDFVDQWLSDDSGNDDPDDDKDSDDDEDDPEHSSWVTDAGPVVENMGDGIGVDRACVPTLYASKAAALTAAIRSHRLQRDQLSGIMFEFVPNGDALCVRIGARMAELAATDTPLAVAINGSDGFDSDDEDDCALFNSFHLGKRQTAAERDSDNEAGYQQKEEEEEEDEDLDEDVYQCDDDVDRNAATSVSSSNGTSVPNGTTPHNQKNRRDLDDILDEEVKNEYSVVKPTNSPDDIVPGEEPNVAWPVQSAMTYYIARNADSHPVCSDVEFSSLYAAIQDAMDGWVDVDPNGIACIRCDWSSLKSNMIRTNAQIYEAPDIKKFSLTCDYIALINELVVPDNIKTEMLYRMSIH